MRAKNFGKTGKKVPEIGMGTYYDPLWIVKAHLGLRSGASDKLEAIRAGLDAGIALLDTAEIYGSEPIVAKALAQRKRENIFLATKVWSNHLHRDDLIKALEGSLRRLGTSYVDLYQVHWPSPKVPIRETMGAMEELVSQGKILHVGVSNFDPRQTQEANEALPKSQLSAVQLDYSLGNRQVEGSILPYCAANGIALLAYYPLGHGKLVSDARLDDIASRYGKKRSQVALRWLAGKPDVFPIPRASKSLHVIENAGATGWELQGDDVARLEALFP